MDTLVQIDDARKRYDTSEPHLVDAGGQLARLRQPFRRLSSDAGALSDGVGLGLAIVQAIADAHDAIRTAQASTGGGLVIDVASRS